MKASFAMVPVMALWWSEEQLSTDYLRLRHTGPTPEIMVCGAISYDGRRTLVVIPSTLTANLYINMAIQPIELPFMEAFKGVSSNRITLAFTPLLLLYVL
ncbi:HTH_Tnp_Tc3_2 domain-containing protein [Trichonephila clavipes]|nr:HTH_Tnp_Tc3_2 domain-containing protein [Trichonephila clavipes]